MLTITVGTESYDDEKEEFVVVDGFDLELEHSLVSLSKWESKFRKSWVGTLEKTPEESLEYIQMMTLTPDVPPEVWGKLSEANLIAIHEYLGDSMTATTFNDVGAPKSKDIVTAELVYYWMTAFNIDWQAQYWHINRLFTLIRVCGLKQQPEKKLSRAEIAQRNHQLNLERRQRLNTTG